MALVFLLPLAAAFLMYYGEAVWRPRARSNHGALLDPVVNLRGELPASPLLARIAEHWVLMHVDEDPCGRGCRDALYTLRQARLMLGPDMRRLRRVFLHGEDPPDTVFLAREHEGLIALQAPAVTALLDTLRPGGLDAGGYWLIDPLGNLVMYFPRDIVPQDMVEDVSHLLELSRIG